MLRIQLRSRPKNNRRNVEGWASAILAIGLSFPGASASAQAVPSPREQQPIQQRPSPSPRSGNPGATSSVDSANVTDEGSGHTAGMPPVVPAGRKIVGVALEGGGALGLAHVGFLQWMEEHHIAVDRLAGTSMGSLIGALYASGKSPAQIEQIATSDAFKDVFALRTPYNELSFRRREDRRVLPQGIEVGLKGGPSLRNSVLTDSGLVSFLQDNLARYSDSSLNYDKLPIPYRCIATDLTTLQAVVFDGGPLPQAVRASISIPGIFAPVEYRGHYLVDGAIVDNLPTDIVKRDLQADVVIGVHLKTTGFSAADVSSIVGVFTRAYAAGTASTERKGESLANLVVAADTSQFSTSDYANAKKIVATGYKAAAQNAKALEVYALNDADWSAYLADRRSREVRAMPILQAIRVEGATAGARAIVQSALAPMKGHVITSNGLEDAVQKVQDNGTYQASVETFDPDHLAPADQMQGRSPDTGVLIKLSPVRNGPPFLLFGADITAASSNVTRTTFDFRLINQDLGGFGSELRSDLRVGFLTQVSSEYYWRLSQSNYFLQPHIGVLREPVYIWQNQKRISERLQQQAGGGLDFGRTVNQNFQASLQYRAEVIRWHLVDGNDSTAPVSGTAQTAIAHVVYNTQESGTLSPSGTRLQASAGALFDSASSTTAPILQFSAARSFSLPNGIIGFSVDANSYFGRAVAEPLRFTLGGPLRLSASSIDEYRGTDDFLARAGYFHRIASLPSGVGDGLYATFGYEAGKMWSPEHAPILVQDGFLLGLASTPVGVIQFGGSIGDAAHRKIFFSFGRLF